MRELSHCLRAAIALAGDRAISIANLPEPIREARGRIGDEDGERERRDELVALLREHRGNVSAVARSTGKARQQIHRWMKRYRIDPDDYRE